MTDIEKQLDHIYDRVDDLMYAGRILELDQTDMREALASSDLDVVLGYLTATLPVKTQLSLRPAVALHARQLCAALNEDVEAIMHGLE